MSAADQIGELRFPVKASWIAGGFVMVLTALYGWATKSAADTVVFLAASSAGAGAVLSAFYAGRALTTSIEATERARQASERTIEESRKVQALELGRRWNDPSLYHVRDAVRSIFDLESSKKDEIMEIAKNQATNVIHFLNFLEEVAMKIDNQIVDETVTRDQFEGIVTMSWSRLEDWIIAHRKQRNRLKQWIKLQALANNWTVK